MSARIIRPLGPCADGHGQVVAIHGFDTTHMGFALAMLKDRWATFGAETPPQAPSVAGSWPRVDSVVPVDELLRSALELAVSLAVSGGTGRAPDGRAIPDGEAGARALTVLSDRYRQRSHPLHHRLCDDLLAWLPHGRSPGPFASVLTVHLVDLTTALDVCAALVTHTEVERGQDVAAQFRAYEALVADVVRRQIA